MPMAMMARLLSLACTEEDSLTGSQSAQMMDHKEIFEFGKDGWLRKMDL